MSEEIAFVIIGASEEGEVWAEGTRHDDGKPFNQGEALECATFLARANPTCTYYICEVLTKVAVEGLPKENGNG